MGSDLCYILALPETYNIGLTLLLPRPYDVRRSADRARDLSLRASPRPGGEQGQA